MSDYRLGITALGRQAVISRRSKKDPRLAVGGMQNVHNDFIQAIIDFCDDGKSVQTISLDGKPVYEIEVRKLSDESIISKASA